MGLLNFIKKSAVKIEIKQNNIFTFPYDKQKEILNSFPEPKSLIERSFFQYKCQMKLYGRLLAFVLNLISLPLLLYYFLKPVKIAFENKKKNAVFFSDGKPVNIIPHSLEKQFGFIDVIENKCMYYTNEDKNYIKNIWRKYPFAWLFLLKNIIKIQYYSYEINKKSPKAVITCNEYSFTSSILTDYCRKRDIQHINVMHGEKLFYIMDSFFAFDKCYVWNNSYIELFKSLRAEKNQFIVLVPDSITFSKYVQVEKEYDFVFYLGSEHGKQLKQIVEILEQMLERGERVAIRPHPRYTDINELRQLTNKINIERITETPIELSIMRTNNAISLYSTVLNQAYNNGVCIVLDDITDKDKYAKLQELNYIMTKVDHKLWSNCLEKL